MKAETGTGGVDAARRAEIAAAFREQGVFCRNRDASFTAAVVEAAAGEIEDGGALLDLVAGFDGDPLREALPLRVAGALHALVLAGRAGGLAAYYEAADVEPGADALRKAMAPLWETEAPLFARYIAKPPQTNEIRRAAALLPGFSKIAAISNGPLDLLELGASAGMLLGWDRFRYEYKAGQDVVARWGDSDAVIETAWRGNTPPDLHAPIKVRRRAGCDLHPFDLSDPDQRLHARSYIWPEDMARRALFDKALQKNAALSAHVEKADALSWLEAALEGRAEGAATVVYHSVFAPYLSAEQLARKQALLEAAGEAATARAPLAWLRFEPVAVGDGMEFFTDLQVWPETSSGGRTLRLVRAHPHGAWVESLADLPLKQHSSL